MLPTCEKAVLAIVMDRPELAETLFDNLTDEYFHGATLAVFQAMTELRSDGMDYRWATVRDRLGDKFGPAFWDDMLASTRGVHFSGAEAFLKEKVHLIKTEHNKKKLLAEISTVAGKAALDDDDVDMMGQTVQSMRLIGKPKESPGFADAMNEYNERIRQEASDITTGLRGIDRRVDGFNAGELVTILARAGTGKTFMALNILNHLAGKVPFKLAMFSLEMPKSAIVERAMEVYFGFSRGEIKARALDGTLYLKDFLARFAKVDIYDRIYSATEIRKIIEREGYRAVFIDFLHLVKPEIIGSPYQQISRVIADLKQTAKDTGSVAFLLHQLSRQAGSGEVQVEAAHARDSGQIEELSDFLIGIWNPGLAKDAPPDTDDQLMVRLLKNKRGERWTVVCQFDKRNGRITEIEEDMDYGRGNKGGSRGIHDGGEYDSTRD